MSASQGSLRPFIAVSGSAALYNTVSYPSGGNSMNSATFVATFSSGVTVITVPYVISGQIVPGMTLSGIGMAAGTYIVGPQSNSGTGSPGIGNYIISVPTSQASNSANVASGTYNAPGSVITASSFPQSYPQGPGGIVGPIPGFNCVNIMDVRDYYNLPYPPATPLASPPVIAVVSFGGGIYGQAVTTGQYAGFWKCTDISGSNGSPIQILVVPINGAINAPNADDAGATLENTVDVATVNAFYGMVDPRRDAPVYTPPVIILYIAPSGDISEMYRTFYTVLKNPVVCNGKSYLPSVVTCSWGAPEIAWTQKMPFPPNPSIPVDNSPDQSGIAAINEINDLFAEATRNGINICCATGDIPLQTVNSSVNTYNYAQALLLQGAGGNGAAPGQVAAPQASVFPLTNAERASLPPPQVMFPASSPYVTAVGGSAIYFPSVNTGSYANPAEFAWTRSNGGISTVFSIPAYQQNLPGSAATSATQFLASSINTTNLANSALGLPSPVVDPSSGSITAPNTALVLAQQIKQAVYDGTVTTLNSAQNTLNAAMSNSSDEAVANLLIQTVKDASTALSTAKSNLNLANDAVQKATDVVVKTERVSALLSNAGAVFGAAAAATGANGAAIATQQTLLTKQFNAQQAAYTQLVSPSTTNAVALQLANSAVQAATAAATVTALASTTLPAAVGPATDLANNAIQQAGAAVIAPSLSTHPYLYYEPVDSPIVPKSNLAYDAAQAVSATISYDSTATTAPSYLLTSLGLGYNALSASDPSGTPIDSVRTLLNKAVTRADDLVYALVNTPDYRDSSGIVNPAGVIGQVAAITNASIIAANGQLDASGTYVASATAWKTAAARSTMLPAAGTPATATAFATAAIALAKSGAAKIADYASGATSDSTMPGYQLPCGVASAAASALAAVYPVSPEEINQDKASGLPLGSTDIYGGIDGSGTYNGITPALVNLRNIYANTTLASLRTKDAAKAALDSQAAFFAWTEANELVNTLQSQATTLYGLVPGPSNDEVKLMNAKLSAAKIALSDASYILGSTEKKAVKAARLAQQSAASMSLFMGNWIDASGGLNIKFDQLGNLMSVPNSVPAGSGQPSTVGAQGANKANCPLINLLDASGSVAAKKALTAAQSMALAAANDNYLTTSTTTWNTHSPSGVDTSGNQSVSLTGTRLLVQDAQYAAAGASAQVANVAFADASESVARFTDWHNLAMAANSANTASAKVYAALVDASGGTMPTDASGNTTLVQAVNAITNTVSLLVSVTTPYNQQATSSATIATNDVVVLAAKLENVIDVCMAAQTAIQLAASSYTSGQGTQAFTVNMAYAKVTADAALAACTAAAILSREDAVLAARRANRSAIALKNLVGDSVIGEAIAGFLDASGNLVSQTGYGPDASGNQFPLRKATGFTGTNGIKPPAVSASTILYQGSGGIAFSNSGLGPLQSGSSPQPSVITNLAYTSSNYNDVYSATSGLVKTAQAVITVLETDSSGNSTQLANSLTDALTYPNVNAVNALNATIGNSGGAGIVAVQNCLLAAYEAQQWVAASANASFVTFSSSPANVNLVTFTPSLVGVINKLASDASACLQTVLNAEAAILYALSLRSSPVLLHDVDASNFASVINANQVAADTYSLLTDSALAHEHNAIAAFHMGDLANALSPLAATSATSAAQAAALGGLTYTAPIANSSFIASQSLVKSGFPGAPSTTQRFPAGGWNSVSMPAVGFNSAFQMNNSLNPNAGPYNGTATGAAPFPALNASSSSRAPAPAAQTLQVSASYILSHLSNVALATAQASSDAADSISKFNNTLVTVSTITPSLVDAATDASNLMLAAAQSANYASSQQTQGDIYPNQASVSFAAKLLQDEFAAIIAARESADSNLQATTPSDARYASRKNMLDLWNTALDAASDAVAASVNSPTSYPTGTSPANITPASLGNLAIMGQTSHSGAWASPLTGNTAPYAVANDDQVVYSQDNTITSSLQASLLGKLNAAVIAAYNATTGAPDAAGNYRYIQFLSAPSTVVTNFPENVNDTLGAYSNAVAALNANAALGNAPIAALRNAALKIAAAYDAAVAVATSPPELPASLPSNATSGIATLVSSTGFTQKQVAAQVAVAFWNSANQFVATMLDSSGNGNFSNLTLKNVFNLMAIAGINFTTVYPSDTSSAQASYANTANAVQAAIEAVWANAGSATWTTYVPTAGNSLSTNAGATAYGLPSYSSTNFLASAGIASGRVTSGASSYAAPSNWGAYYWTLAVSDNTQTISAIALQAATDAWNAVLSLLQTYMVSPTALTGNAQKANIAKAKGVYAVKIALQSAARVQAAAQISANANNALANATNASEDLAAYNAAETCYDSTSRLNMFRCVPDIAMHANADDLPIIFKLNGSAVYVGGTAVAAAMFAGFLGVVQSQSPANYFVNPLLYDNYTFPSPLYNDISGSSQVWYTGSPAGSTIPPRIVNILPGLPTPTSGLGSGLYNLNVGLGSIKGFNLAALMEVPHLVTSITPSSGPAASVTVYPGTSSTITVYVEPATAYNPYVNWSCNSLNAVVSQSTVSGLSNNGMNDTAPYTKYNPLLHDASGNTLTPTPSVGDYSLGSVGNVILGTNPYTENPCLVFTATVTGITAVPSSAALPIITVSSTDGSTVFATFNVSVLPAIQVSGVSISINDSMQNPANTNLFLGTTLQLNANVTPLNATNQRVFWWSSNSAVVNVDASGLLTSLAPGSVTIKATTLNNNISSSISVYVPTPITGMNILPTSITLNPNMGAHPLRNSGLIRAIIQPENADYKHLTWEIISFTQSQPAPAGITDVINLPTNGTILSRDANGNIMDNTQAYVTAVSNGTALIKVSTFGEPYGVYGTYTSNVTVNVVTPLTDIVMTQTDMVINLNPHTAQYDSSRSLPESYHVTATIKPAYPSNMNVFWSSSNPKVAVVSNNSKPVLNTSISDPNYGLFQITETITPLSNGTTVIKVTTADGQKVSMTTVVVTTPVTGLSMSSMPVVLNPGRVYNLQAAVLPSSATNKAISWESTNSSVATVDANGAVSAVATGSCGIIATTADGDYTAISQVNVVTPLVGVQLLVNTPLPIHVGDVVQILVVMVPTTASNQLFTWSVTDGPNGPIFTTGGPQNGNIVYLEPVQIGNSVFTVTTTDGNKQASINLNVLSW